MAGFRAQVKERTLAVIAGTGGATKHLVAIPESITSEGDLEARISNVAGNTIAAGIFAHDATAGETVDIETAGIVTGICLAALATLYTQLSYNNAGKLKAAVSGEFVVGHNLSTTSAADEKVSVQWYDNPHIKA